MRTKGRHLQFKSKSGIVQRGLMGGRTNTPQTFPLTGEYKTARLQNPNKLPGGASHVGSRGKADSEKHSPTRLSEIDPNKPIKRCPNTRTCTSKAEKGMTEGFTGRAKFY